MSRVDETRHWEGNKEMNGKMLGKQQIAFQCKCEKHDDI